MRALNQSLLKIMQDEGRTFLTSTESGGQSVLRVCIINFRTREADLDTLLDAMAQAGGGCCSRRAIQMDDLDGESMEIFILREDLLTVTASNPNYNRCSYCIRQA
ncbi:MAG: hypothetical protein IH587_07290 [Anaerolineae bacterium]|nr:hypothetical protein [Anaerolineae bacterium]